MITRKADREVVHKEHVFGGAGDLTNVIITPADEMYGKNRLFQHCYLNKGCEVAYHEHHGDGEVYYVLAGVGEFNDNGTVTTDYPGDACWTPDGQGHSMKCISDETLEFIALVVNNH